MNFEIKNESEYVRRAFEKYDCGLISLIEYSHLIGSILEYGLMREEVQDSYARLYDLQNKLERI